VTAGLSSISFSVILATYNRGDHIKACLRRDRETILTLRTPAMFCPDDVLGNGDRRTVGVPVGDIVIDCLTSRARLEGRTHSP
jgi:hypothetical protein